MNEMPSAPDQAELVVTLATRAFRLSPSEQEIAELQAFFDAGALGRPQRRARAIERAVALASCCCASLPVEVIVVSAIAKNANQATAGRDRQRHGGRARRRFWRVVAPTNSRS